MPSIFDPFDEEEADEPSETTPALPSGVASTRVVVLSSHSGPSIALLCLSSLPLFAAMLVVAAVIFKPSSTAVVAHDSVELSQTYAPTSLNPTMFPSTANPSSFPTTASPTSNSPVTSSPVPDPDPPVLSLADERYGPVAPVFSAKRLDMWMQLATNRSNFGKTWKNIKVDFDPKTDLLIGGGFVQAPNQFRASLRGHGDQLHAMNCNALNSSTPKLKYEEPNWKAADASKPVQMARHYRQHKAFLADYYELPKGLPNTATPAAMKNLQAVMARVLSKKKLVLGFQGSSVMSGQDNCHYWIYSETLKRHFTRILSPYGIVVEARNMGQNGDGTDQMTQLLFAPDVLGADVDIQTIWYPMMPNASPAEQAMLLRRWINQKTFVHIMTFDSRDWKEFTDYFFQMTQSWEDNGIYNLALHWGGGWEGGWSKHGDGRCHLVTREDQDGVWMWNWVRFLCVDFSQEDGRRKKSDPPRCRRSFPSCALFFFYSTLDPWASRCSQTWP